MADDEIETQVLGLPIKARGINSIGMVILACALAACMWLLYVGNAGNNAQLISIHETLAARADEHREMMTVLRNLMEAKVSTSAAINEQNYIILSDAAERERLKRAMSMPQSLREKLNH